MRPAAPEVSRWQEGQRRGTRRRRRRGGSCQSLSKEGAAEQAFDFASSVDWHATDRRQVGSACAQVASMPGSQPVQLAGAFGLVKGLLPAEQFTKVQEAAKPALAAAQAKPRMLETDVAIASAALRRAEA